VGFKENKIDKRTTNRKVRKEAKASFLLTKIILMLKYISQENMMNQKHCQNWINMGALIAPSFKMVTDRLGSDHVLAQAFFDNSF
jgi:hypothetical protein